MRKIIVLSFITLDGVIQAPGGPEEDPSNGFQYGGWIAPYGDDVSGKIMEIQLQPADLMLGRKTFDIWESYWPQHAAQWPGVNEVNKYVLSSTRETSDWQNSIFINSIEDIKKIKQSDGIDIKIWGSSELVHLLLQQELVDEFWLNIYPILLGKGKRLFDDQAVPAAFSLVESTVTPNGVIMAHYKRAGEVKTGTVED
ncbi:MAG: dihydrofolate reductase [Cytophagaceae bacterium]|jgi:dihydrofolate reductase|nr:dihydrofolate reductase [Cytophagaceae bacterium]